jgi:hypothetical protein
MGIDILHRINLSRNKNYVPNENQAFSYQSHSTTPASLRSFPRFLGHEPGLFFSKSDVKLHANPRPFFTEAFLQNSAMAPMIRFDSARVSHMASLRCNQIHIEHWTVVVFPSVNEPVNDSKDRQTAKHSARVI